MTLINRTTPNSVQNTEKQNAQRSEGTQCCRQRRTQILKGCQDLKEGRAPGGPDVRLVAESCPTLCSPVESSPPDSSVHGDSPGKNTGVENMCPPPEDPPNPGIEPASSTLQADSLPTEPPGKHSGLRAAHTEWLKL